MHTLTRVEKCEIYLRNRMFRLNSHLCVISGVQRYITVYLRVEYQNYCFMKIFLQEEDMYDSAWSRDEQLM